MDTPETTRISGGNGDSLALVCFGEPTNDTLPEWAVNGARLEPGSVGSRLVAETEDGTQTFVLELYGPARFDWMDGTRICLFGTDADTDLPVCLQMLPRMSDPEFDAALIIPANASSAFRLADAA